MMPMSVVGTPLSTNVWPRTPGSRLYWLSHILCAMTKTGGESGLASAGVNVRPKSAGTPRNVKHVGGRGAAIEEPRALARREEDVLVRAPDDVFEHMDLLQIVQELRRLKERAAAPGRLLLRSD